MTRKKILGVPVDRVAEIISLWGIDKIVALGFSYCVVGFFVRSLCGSTTSLWSLTSFTVCYLNCRRNFQVTLNGDLTIPSISKFRFTDVIAVLRSLQLWPLLSPFFRSIIGGYHVIYI